MRSAQVARGGFAWSDLENLQGWRLRILFGQPVLLRGCPQLEKKSLYVCSEPRLICLLPVVLYFPEFRWKMMAVCCSLEVRCVSSLVDKSTSLM